MADLEMKGFQLDGVQYQIFVCLVERTGDNLGLNGILGFVESFTASYSCRQCKVKRKDFSMQLFEITDKLRTPKCMSMLCHLKTTR